MKKKRRNTLLLLVCLAVIAIGIFAISQLLMLRKAHSTFENYYTFRGCMYLVKRTNDYGICTIASGKTIKIVKFRNKWYLDGDLPFCLSSICF